MTSFRTRDGLTLAYRLAGTGPLLVCQSGGPGRESSYLRDLGGLTETRTLLLLDARGTGASERPDDRERLGAWHLADDLADLREHLGVASFDLLGHSAGAVVAQLYAAAHPATVRRLVLVTPSGRLQGSAGDDVPAIVDRRRAGAATDPALAAALAAWDRGASGGPVRPLYYGTWNADAAAHAAGADTEVDPVVSAMFWPRRLPADAPDPERVVAALGAVTAPVLVLAGEHDAITGVEAAHSVAASFPAATVEVLAGCGHFPWVDRPAAFAAAVGAFLDG